MKVLKAKSKWLFESDLRLDAEYHLSDGPISQRLIKKSPYIVNPLSKVVNELYKGNIFRRTYVRDSIKGLPFITASDMITSDVSTDKFLSKKYTNNLSGLNLRDGMILVSRSGTLGVIVLTNKSFQGLIGSDDLIRIVPDNKEIRTGFLYAYLASKYGYSLLIQSSYGGVVKHIEPHHIENLPVPIFKSKLQEEIHNLVIESGRLRDQAFVLLKNAIEAFESNLPKLKQPNIYGTSIQNLKRNHLRIDAQSRSEIVFKYYAKLRKTFEVKTIKDLTEEVFTPNIFKRVRVNNSIQGVPYLSGSDLLAARPKFDSYLSKKMKNIDDYKLREGWIAMQDAGSIGYVTFVNGYLDGVAATNNLVRIKPHKANFNPYIFAFLKSTIGQDIIKSFQYGSVQKHIDDKQVASIGIPILTKEFKSITSNMVKYLANTTQACKLEAKAISLVEKEIQSWQK